VICYTFIFIYIDKINILSLLVWL